MTEGLTLGDVCSDIVDCEHKTAPIDGDGEYFAVGTPAMRRNKIDLSEARRINEETFYSWTRRLRPQHGDLLFAREAPVGPIVLIPIEANIAPGQRTVLLRPDGSIVESKYLYYLLGSPQQQALIGATAAGSTVAHLNVADVRRFVLPVLPELDEQRAIAEVLGALDDKIADNTLLVNTAEELAEVLFLRGNSGLPKVPMSEVCEPILGGTPKRSAEQYWDGDVPWASAKDIAAAPAGIIIDTIETITELAADETKAKPLPEGSVVLTARGTVGAVARLGVPAAINQSCYGFAPGALPAGVLYFAIRSIAAQVRSMAHGSVFDTITKRTFDHVLVPDSSSPEVSQLEADIEPLLNTIKSVVRENERLAQTRDALLPLLMSGRVTVKDAEQVVEEAV